MSDAREIAKMTATGQIEAILEKRAEILALKPEELDKLSKVMNLAAKEGNGCCTGG